MCVPGVFHNDDTLSRAHAGVFQISLAHRRAFEKVNLYISVEEGGCKKSSNQSLRCEHLRHLNRVQRSALQVSVRVLEREGTKGTMATQSQIIINTTAQPYDRKTVDSILLGPYQHIYQESIKSSCKLYNTPEMFLKRYS